MRFRPSRSLLATLLCALFAAAPLAAADRSAQREQFRAGLAAATKPPEGVWKRYAASLEESGYPLAPYVELAALRPRIAQLERTEVERFLKRWPDTLPAADLRDAYLRELARRSDWSTFRALWRGSADRDLVCDELQARIAAGTRLDYARDLDTLWQGSRTLPGSCDPVLRAARAQGVLTDARLWERIERAAAAGNGAAVSDAAALLDNTAARAAADRIATAVRDPDATLAKAKGWSDTPRARDAVAYGLARYARRNSSAAETLWADFESRFRWDPAQKNRVLNALAVYRSTSYSPDAMARLKALPEDAEDDATREWRVRVALAGGDFGETLAALERLSETQKADSRWRYLRARVLTRLDRKAEAAPLFAAVAREPSFHGFLAADWIDRPYAICPRTLARDPKTEAALARQPDLERAFEFRDLGMLPEARREWNFAMGRLDANARRLAVDLAYRRGWYDRAVYAYSADPDTQRLYEQRFPLAMEKLVKREAQEAGVDPAWGYAIIRAESAWTTDARSHADAYGLMQLLPAVAKQLARAERLAYGNAQDLFNPDINVPLGMRYLARMAGKYEGSPWLASAAYNAGEAPVGRWLDARASLDPDFFIETIPYKETREYVARVLAFSVIYDWRMNGKTQPLSARMPKIGQAYRPPSASTPLKAVACAEVPPSDATAAAPAAAAQP